MNQNLIEQRKQIIANLIADEHYVPMKRKEMAMLLNIVKGEREEFNHIIDLLIQEGQIEESIRGKLKKPEEKLLIGIFEGHQRGFGFVTVEGMEEDFFVSESDRKGALHKDNVQIIISKDTSGKRKEAKVVKIISRGTNEVIGTFQKSKNYGFVVSDNPKFDKDIFVPSERSKGAVNGAKVVVAITNYGSQSKNPEGKVIEILGHVNDPGVDILSIIKSYELPTGFPENVMDFVEHVPDSISEAECQGRIDLRNKEMVTIDGEDAKDLDDAVSIEKEGELYKLGVHIADVTNYVTEGNDLDKEALKRGTSVYLVDRVIPMLPHRLSNGICSLNAGVDRLALSCLMTINNKGEVVDYKIAETVICVDQRMSYTEVKKILEDEDEETIQKYKKLIPMFHLMKELADILRERRRKRGSIDFDFPESKIILDSKGTPIDVKPYERNVATKIIEDFMLIANETVAEHFFWQETPFVYRTHDIPDNDRIKKLSLFINNFGYTLKISQDEVHPKELQKLLEKIENTDEESLISRLTLRSMKQAKYGTISTGHFGLATSYYCHFTSPIRRYPDLQIHRIIKESLRKGLTEKRIKHYNNILPDVAKHSSETERRADEAERETDKLKKAEYMDKRIGQVFDGVISSITNWGLYVELPNTIEGMVHVTALDGDYYYYDEQSYEMVGEHTNKRYKLGQKVRIQVVGTNRINRTIDFKIVSEEEDLQVGEGEL